MEEQDNMKDTNAEQSPAEEAQIEAADSGKIIIGGEVQDVAELLKDENIKRDVMNFLSDPESPENVEWARINPEFSDWLSRELESLNVTTAFSSNVTANFNRFLNFFKKNGLFLPFKNISPYAINNTLFNLRKPP